MLVAENQEILKRWLAEKLESECPIGQLFCIGQLGANGINAVVAYENFTPQTVKMHIAGDREVNWLTRKLLSLMFVYPFEVRKVGAVFATIKRENVKSLNFVKKLGFVEFGASTKDFCVFVLVKSHCKYIKGA